jgi:dihydroorotate dehydrogenase electron transfer subunit
MNSECQPIQADALILENQEYRPWLFRLRLAIQEIASAIRPGQFVMIRSAWGNDPLLGRPLALYDLGRDEAGEVTSIDVIYQLFGRGTKRLSQMQPGDKVRVWGPLGHSFSIDPGASRIWFVAGGVGYTPFLALADWWQGKTAFGGSAAGSSPGSLSISMIYGARSKSLLPPLDDFRAAGVELQICTDDGTEGAPGRVTDVMTRRWNDLNTASRPDLIVTCGPEPMLAAVAAWCAERDVRCQVSLENQMACGFGACFSCVAPIRQADGSTDLKRVCLEGPIFDASAVAWGHP